MDKRKGFTIVELIVVIVVIAILAAITLVGYSMIQKRANDARRITDITTLQKAIETYAYENGAFPTKGPGSSWSTSEANPTNYIQGISGPNSGMSSLDVLPLDPSNSSTYYYRYYVYSTHTGCDNSRSPFYVLQIIRMESGYGPSPTSTDPVNKSPESPGWKCGTNRDWDTEAAYTVGGYLH